MRAHGFFVVVLAFLVAAAGVEADEDQEMFQALRLLRAAAPAPITPEVEAAMRRVAEAGKLEGAEALIDALAFWRSAGAQNESDVGAHLPAVGYLWQGFGPRVVPLLFYRGVTTDQTWLRERCAAAVQLLYSRWVPLHEREVMRQVFNALPEATGNAGEFGRLLEVEGLATTMLVGDLAASDPTLAAWRANWPRPSGRRQDVGRTGYLNYVLSETLGSGTTAVEGRLLTVSWSAETPGRAASGAKNAGRLRFVAGAHQVGEGIEVAVADMRVGGRRTLRMREEVLGGIRESFPGLPPESVLEVTLELFEVELEEALPSLPSRDRDLALALAKQLSPEGWRHTLNFRSLRYHDFDGDGSEEALLVAWFVQPWGDFTAELRGVYRWASPSQLESLVINDHGGRFQGQPLYESLVGRRNLHLYADPQGRLIQEWHDESDRRACESPLTLVFVWSGKSFELSEVRRKVPGLACLGLVDGSPRENVEPARHP